MTPPKTAISLDDLWDAALPEVIGQLRDSGYTVEEVEEDDPPQAAVKQLRPHQMYRLEPGPATLTAVTNPTDDGSIQFVLTGPNSVCASAQKKSIQCYGCDWSHSG